jgi:hypothetical protein
MQLNKINNINEIIPPLSTEYIIAFEELELRIASFFLTLSVPS